MLPFFVLVQDPPYDDKSFAKIVTQDASLEGGSAKACAPNMRQGWKTLFKKGGSKAGREEVSEAMLLCPHAKLESEDDVQLLAQWLQSAWDYLAMVRCMLNIQTVLHRYLGLCPIL